MNYFTITTNKEVADKIVAQCKMDERVSPNRSYKLGQVRTETEFSVVQICAKDQLIKPADLFWLGFTAANK